MSQPQPNYGEWAERCYGPNWPQLSQSVKQMTGGKCCLCHHQAKYTHHIRYNWDGEGDAGGDNLFPLCPEHHRLAHQRRRYNRKTQQYSGNWIKVSDCPVTGRYNTPEFAALLRRGWKKSLVKKGEPNPWLWAAIAIVLLVMLFR